MPFKNNDSFPLIQHQKIFNLPSGSFFELSMLSLLGFWFSSSLSSFMFPFTASSHSVAFPEMEELPDQSVDNKFYADAS